MVIIWKEKEIITETMSLSLFENENWFIFTNTADY
jgi:hypothetical protein